MAAIIFDPAAFREQFPSFQCTPAISNTTLQAYFDTATMYINNPNCGNYTRIGGLSAAQRKQCLYLMTAHLGTIARSIESGTGSFERYSAPRNSWRRKSSLVLVQDVP